MSLSVASVYKEMEKMKKSNEALIEACRCAFDYSVPIEVRKDKVYQAIANAEGR